MQPSKEEYKFLNKEVSNFIKKIKTKDMTPVAGGSFAKDTWLSREYDIDIFAKFNYNKYKKKDISKELKKILNKKFKKVIILHGSRDYFQIKNKITFEIIPVLNITSSKLAKNITDMSPLHAKYINKKLNNKLANEVRLLKQFCKANDVYGAESYIKGFSGYVLELLIVNYKSFKNLIKNASKWKSKTILDPEKHHKNKDILNVLNKSKIYSPLIIIDPVQKERNAAAAISKERYNKFIKLCKSYLKVPSDKFFIKKELDLKKLKDYTILKVKPLKGKKDIIGSKLLKAFEFIKKELEKEGFKLKDSNWKWEKDAYFYFLPEKDKLKSYKIHYGPRLKDKKHMGIFKKKWEKIYKDKNRVFTKIKRKKIKFKDVIKGIIKENYLKNKVRKIIISKK